MMENCVFTICAHNYMAQALTLQQSVLKYNKVDFKIFLADTPEESPLFEKLDESWIPNWRNMAFQYNITEFNTSIKPFCFNKLFEEGYKKVVYLDPDMFVVDSVNLIWDILDNKSIILTPHFCDMRLKENQEYREKEMLQDGICNLGFCAISNNDVGREIVDWWKDRLTNQCFNDKAEGLFTDQKWMMFIPILFPDETCVSHNMGFNVAVWNLHERNLEILNGKFYIRRLKDQSLTSLIFFHFSGFNPLHPIFLTRRKPNINIDTYPSFRPILEEYTDIILANNFAEYSKKKYGFAAFSNGEEVSVLQRRLYRKMLEQKFLSVAEDPFDSNGIVYNLFKKKRLLTKTMNIKGELTKESHGKTHDMEHKYVYPCLKFLCRILGEKYYTLFIKLCAHIGKFEYHYFLLSDN